MGCVVALGEGITASSGLARFDIAFGTLTRGAATDFDHHASVALSALAATDVALPLAALAAPALWLLRMRREAIAVPAGVLCTQGVVELMKTGFERPRPPGGADAAGFSFPSAHSATAVALYGAIAAAAAGRVSGPIRVAVVATGSGLVASIGLSRVVLAAHHPVDVVGGWLTGGAVALACWWLAGRIPLSGLSHRPRLRWRAVSIRAQKGTS